MINFDHHDHEQERARECHFRLPYIAHMRTKHIDIRYHFIHEAIQDQVIEVCYFPSEDMIADLLTKPLSKRKFKALRDQMGIKERQLLVNPFFCDLK
uniref:Reverse transcriptase Ty1/copia-type domain-containing protein n=1 Tax=Amphimedon queenslandica TaxID=400682 RepID=A0A1X7VGI0_AMPQE